MVECNGVQWARCGCATGFQRRSAPHFTPQELMKPFAFDRKNEEDPGDVPYWCGSSQPALGHALASLCSHCWCGEAQMAVSHALHLAGCSPSSHSTKATSPASTTRA